MATDMLGQISAHQINDNAIESRHIKEQAIITSKIADNAVIGSSKIAASSITAGQLSDGVKIVRLSASSIEDTVIGTAEGVLKSMEFGIRADVALPDKIKFVIEVKSSATTETATYLIYFDEETTARASVTSTSTTYEVLTISTDVGTGPQALATGKHCLFIKGKSSATAGIAYNKLCEIWQVQR
ncbi:MAG TPA: hypothetical protein VJB38_12390 [Bacteroidota bacterium]|nr:hypothetical protein [Bacteroidota bacterium]